MTIVASTSIASRAEALDALDAILPFDRRYQLATLLTDDNVETLKHLAGEGMGEKHAQGACLRPRLP